jgi:L,D-transpeptidase-like protein
VPSCSVAFPFTSGRAADAGALLVLAAARDRTGRCWVRVRLPSRPNHAKGWLLARRVELNPTPWRIEVRRSTRTVMLLRAGNQVRRWRAVVGAPATPTPAGPFAVLEAWPSPPNAFLGRWIVALTAHSDVLQEFGGGEGRIGLHGRGGASLLDPLGSARSHGCVRLANHAISTLVLRIGRADLPGTPVRVR